MKLQIEYLPITEIKPYERNAKLHPEWQIKQIMRSIEEFGFRDPIGIYNGEIVEGHGRYFAALELGMDTVPVIRLDDMTDEQRKAYALVHNKLTMNSDFNIDLLEIELGDITDIDMGEFGFDVGDGQNEWFDRKDKDGARREEGNEEYNEFLEKFEPKKTTDDCYTPEPLYDAVADWVAQKYGVDRKDFVRPFYPGGDYQQEKYKKTAVVVDNPPFSILSEILRFYTENNISFFLFAPTLTMFSSAAASACCCICCGVPVTYENGASVNTSFVTNMEPGVRLMSAPTLYAAVSEANKQFLKELHKELPKYIYPDYVITSTRCGQFSRYGIDFSVGVNESYRVSQLDAQKETNQTIFGNGYIISEKKKAEKEKAEKEKAEKEKASRWELSEREMEIVKSLA